MSHYKNIFTLTKDKKLHAKIEYQMSLIDFETNNKEKAFKNLKKITEKKVVYPPAYNLLAYIMAEKKVRPSTSDLKNALILANKALSFNNQSPDFLDTKGFILYKQKKYDSAIKIFEEALRLAPKNKIIKKHLNDAKSKIIK